MNNKALIIEDDSSYASMLCSVLKRLGCEGTVVTNQQDIRYLLDAENLEFDFALLDLRLPDHKEALQPLPYVGFEVLRYIRERFDPEELKIIVMTAYEESSQTGIRAMHAGADDYFSKNDSTVNPEEKIKNIISVLKKISDRSCSPKNCKISVLEKKHKVEFIDNTVSVNGIQIQRAVWADLFQLLRGLADQSKGLTAKQIAQKLTTHVTDDAIRQRFRQLKKYLREEHEARGLGNLGPDEIIKNPMGKKGYHFNLEYCELVIGRKPRLERS